MTDTLKKLDQLSEGWCRGEPANADSATLLLCALHLTEVLSEAGPVPAWHKRPTGPGWWVCWSKRKRTRSNDVVLYLDADDIARGSPFSTSSVYGPIPEPPEELKS